MQTICVIDYDSHDLLHIVTIYQPYRMSHTIFFEYLDTSGDTKL